MGMSIALAKNRTLFIADTNIAEFPPDSEALADIATETAAAAKGFGFTPRASPSCPIPPSAIRRASGPTSCRRPCACSTSAA